VSNDPQSENDRRRDPGMVRFQVWLPQAWLDRLHELARERAVSMSDVVRILLRENLYDRKPPE
jgi:metal-responsive CopG/Arc/MetJ family transcriptional regulator